MTREEAGAKLADEYASKHWSGDDYTAAFDSFIAGYQAALTPQPSAEDAAVLDALEEAYADVLDIPDKIAGVDSIAAVNARHTEARAAVLARMAGKVPEGWQPLSTLEHRHAYDAPLVMDGKNMPATYLSDSVILTDGKRVWVERSVIMGGALSSSADKFTAYPSGDKPTHWMPLPAAPKVPT